MRLIPSCCWGWVMRGGSLTGVRVRGKAIQGNRLVIRHNSEYHFWSYCTNVSDLNPNATWMTSLRSTNANTPRHHRWRLGWRLRRRAHGAGEGNSDRLHQCPNVPRIHRSSRSHVHCQQIVLKQCAPIPQKLRSEIREIESSRRRKEQWAEIEMCGTSTREC